jgi:3-oxoacid CoA-transferase subunit A
MIRHWLLTGDTHGNVASRLEKIHMFLPSFKPEETAVIILGDAGLNFWLNKTDKKNKERTSAFGYTIYCVRGNHEERPENLPEYHLEFDGNVDNFIYIDDNYPNIRFFADGVKYNIDGYSILAIGGAYSVDKWYRLSKVESKDIYNPKKTGWFPDELLNEDEREAILEDIKGNKYDFVFSHTCPLEWEPRDLFLSFVDQDSVDKSMEIWFDEVKDNINWGIWCFGHFHADRAERPHVEQYYERYETLNDIVKRWKEYDETGELAWYYPTSPNFHLNNENED